MRGFNNIYERLTGRVIIAAVIALVASLSLSSCHKHHSPEQVPSLQISVYIPQPVATKATVGNVVATEEEKKINELVVWLYRHNDDADASAFYCISLSGTELAKYNLESGQEARFTVLLDTDELEQIASAKPNLDLYAVANPAAAGLTLPATEDGLKALKRSDLEIMSMTGATFGATYDGCPKTDVPTDGLPYSGVATNVPITGSFPVLVVSKVTLMRCVSKFRFVLCRMEVEDSEYQITGITLNGSQFSEKEYVFNTSSNPYKIDTGTGYESGTVSVASSISSSQIAVNNTPGDLLFRSANHESETADQYWSRLDAARDIGTLTDVKTFYVRETDKKLSGTIRYKTTATGTERTKTFEMDVAGDFARNHIWIVYAYFTGGRLVLMPTVLPWTAGNDRFEYSTQGHTDVSVIRWLRYTPDMDYNNWDETWVAVSYGFGSDGVTPKYSTRISFTTTNAYPLKLQLDNDFFQFVIVDETHPTPTAWPTLDYNIEPGTHTFGIWVVPKTSANPSSEEQSKVSVTLICIPSGQPPYLIPISHNFPGDSDHIPIRFRRVSPADYEANKDREYDANVPGQYWLEPTSNE
ncbi:MAG: hypothetical protein IKX26_07920 [Bacteroidales bacterium]|nr:hypothetical protein [Bacteroidales bacterium]